MKSFPGIRAVTFDAGSTLIEPWPSVGHVYAEVAARHGIANASPEELNRRFAAVWRARPRPSDTQAEWAEIVDATFAGLVAAPPRRTFFRELYARFAQADAWRIYDDVAPALAALTARGIRLGVISNWDERLRPLLGALKLAVCFEVIVVSCEVGVAKPAPGIFQIAAAQFGLPGATLLHVGDDFESDVRGARAAGLRAVQVARQAAPAGGDSIRSLREIAGLI